MYAFEMGLLGFILLVVITFALIRLGRKTFSGGLTGFEKAVDIGTPVIKNLRHEVREYTSRDDSLIPQYYSTISMIGIRTSCPVSRIIGMFKAILHESVSSIYIPYSYSGSHSSSKFMELLMNGFLEKKIEGLMHIKLVYPIGF